MPKKQIVRMSRGTAADTVSAALREQIVRGELAEGEPLRQDALAIRFHTSRVPIREALRQLEVEGLVTFHPRRGATVTKLEPSEVLEMFEIRLALECHALRTAIPNMTGEDFDGIDAIMRRYKPKMSPVDWDAMNWEFHAALYLPAHRPRLFHLIKSNYLQASRFLRVRLARATGSERPHREHMQILDACRTRAVDRAVALLAAHIDDSRKQLATTFHRATLLSA